MTTKPPKFAPVTSEAALAMRQKDGTNQSVFWQRVGIGQSAGSRYESGRNIPRPVQMLLMICYGSERQRLAVLDQLIDKGCDDGH